jgi:hypothetical protein
MKWTKAILPLILSYILLGCNKQFDLEPISVITSQNMWKTPNDAASGITGMYSQFRNTMNGEQFLVWFEFRSGFWQNGVSGAAQWTDLYMNTPTATATLFTDYSSFYNVINSANLAIKYIPGITFTSTIEKNSLLAEAHFMRAFCYFALARLWGDVPLVVEPIESIEDPKLYPERSKVNLVFDQIKSDIDKAGTLMEDKGVRNRIRASAAAVNMLKADVYLWTGKRLGGGNADFTTALAAADAVVANSANYQLLTSYEQVFRVDQNNEIIFSIFFAPTELPQNQYGQRFTFQATQVVAAARNNPVPIGTSANWHTLNNHYVTNYHNRTPGDTRAPVNYQVFTSGAATYRWVNKYLGELVSGNRLATSDTRIYRYAEAILFKAEAMNALGNSAGAILELNRIARRAYNVTNFYPATLTVSQVNDAILRERIVEFTAEGKSWFDFIRFGKAFELIPSLVGRQGDREGNILLFPIAPSTLSNNPKIKQTPGY